MELNKKPELPAQASPIHDATLQRTQNKHHQKLRRFFLLSRALALEIQCTNYNQLLSRVTDQDAPKLSVSLKARLEPPIVFLTVTLLLGWPAVHARGFGDRFLAFSPRRAPPSILLEDSPDLHRESNVVATLGVLLFVVPR